MDSAKCTNLMVESTLDILIMEKLKVRELIFSQMVLITKETSIKTLQSLIEVNITLISSNTEGASDTILLTVTVNNWEKIIDIRETTTTVQEQEEH